MTQSFLTEASPKPAIAYGGPLPADPAAPLTLPQALYRAIHQEREAGILYFQPDGTDLRHSYATLSQEAESILAGLRARGLQAGESVILQVEENRDYLPAFWACVLGGLIAVPISIAPSYTQPNITTARLQKAWELCGRPLIVASATLIDALHGLGVALGMENMRVESVEALRASDRSQQEVPWHEAQPDDDVLILFTSGSTGVPKGVTLTHRNILGVARGFTALEGLSPQEISFNWMPLDHIGGLVTFHLRDVFLGCQQIHASPQAILQSPLTWLDCLARYRATCTWAPNFAFSMINEQAPALAEGHWDLSCLRYILNAGEAIVPKTARRFLELLRPHGLISSAIHPSWGMSETSSGVTFSSAFSLETTSDEDRFVDVGALIPDVWVRIVDLQDHLLTEGETGRIQVRGPTVTRGYYNNADLNREVFTADGWFDTGDLGMLRAGRLTVTGRSKQIIIINGLNYYSHEIEAVVEEIPDVEATFTAACAVRDASGNTDALAIFYHTRATKDEEILAQLRLIRKRVIQAVGINPAYLLPLEARAIPKTETGKIQRTRLKQLFGEGAFDSLLQRLTSLNARLEANAAHQEVSGEGMIAAQLVLLWQRLLSLPAIPPETSFFELGGHSLLVMQLVSQIRETFGVALTPRVVFDFPTITALAGEIEARQKDRGGFQYPRIYDLARVLRKREVKPEAESDGVQQSAPRSLEGGEVPLLPGQGWQLLTLRNPHYFNVPFFLSVRQPLDLQMLRQTILYLVSYHDALRLRFSQEGDAWKQFLLDPDQEELLPVTCVDLSTMPEEEQRETFLRLVAEAQPTLNLCHGPLGRVIYFDMGAGRDGRLFWVLNHIICDYISHLVLIEDFMLVYDQIAQGRPATLPGQRTSLKRWAECLHEQICSAALREELENYWLKLPWDQVRRLPADFPERADRDSFQAGRSVEVIFRKEETSMLLRQVLNADTQPLDVFFTALAETFAHWSGSPWLPLYASDHGREPLQADMDLTRTVGFLSWKSLYLLHWEEAEPRQALQAIKRQREATPNKGRGFEMLYYASDQRAKLEDFQIFSLCEVLFNYLGQATSSVDASEMFQMVYEPHGAGLDRNDRREPPTTIQVIAFIEEDCLHMTWDYSENLYRRSTIEQLAQSNRAILLKLISALARK